MTTRFHFVSSGNAIFPSKEGNPEAPMFKEMTEWCHSDLHKMTYLTNAYTEKSMCKQARNIIPADSTSKIYFDSGGLQVVTLGKPLTEEIKQSVYDLQAEHADYGFVFDEMPLKTPDTGSSILHMDSRIFDDSLVEPCAIQAAKNINQQIKTFVEKGSSCKPIAIIQGNCYDSFMKYADILEKNIEPDFKPYITGLAMAGTSLGRGLLEDLDRTYYFNEMPVSFGKKHLHLLAVGSVRRMTPALVGMKNGLYADDMLVSYDASTMSKHLHVGLYHTKHGRLSKIGRKLNQHYFNMYAELVEHFGSDFSDNYTPELMFHINNSNESVAKEENRFDLHKKFKMYHFFAGVKNFINIIDGAFKDDTKLHNLFSDGKSDYIFHSLMTVNNVKDYEYWKTHAGRFLSSSRIPKTASATVEGLFDE